MISLPNIPTQKIAIKLKPVAEKMVKKRHPWVFESSIIKQNKEGHAGDLAVIFDQRKNDFLACGLYDPFSPIRIKLLHVGKPTKIDDEWFSEKINTAFALRAELLETDTNSYRLINGENDGFPGFIADIYNDTLVIKLYAAIWFPYLKYLLPKLITITNCSVVVLRFSRRLQQLSNAYGLADGSVLHGTLENEVVIFKEHGIRFSANVIHGHKTGYFLDHRENRRRVGLLAKGKSVLDVFSYAGGFSVHALANGAKEVTSIDISAHALNLAKENAALNTVTGEHHTIAIDAFEGLSQLNTQKKLFDIVVIDPPSFAKQASEVSRALKSYDRLAKLGVQLVRKNGILVLASCSSRVTAEDFFDTSEKAITAMGFNYTIIEKTTHDVDHPITFPEGAYLKCGYYRITKK